MSDKRKPIILGKGFQSPNYKSDGLVHAAWTTCKKVYERKISRREFWRRLQFSEVDYLR